MRRLWDISPPVHAGSPVFPGDTPYRQRWSWSLGGDCPVNVAEVTTSPHVGAHADAPLHYEGQGQPIGAVDLEPYLGPCRVIHALDAHPVVNWTHLAAALQSLEHESADTGRRHPPGLSPRSTGHALSLIHI